MEQSREMNLFDLCAAFGRAIGRGVKGMFVGIGKMIRLSFRQWWIVLPIVLLFVGLSLYFSREENRRYKVDAIVVINGANKDVVCNEYMALDKAFYTFGHQNLWTMLDIPAELAAGNYRFTTFDVIDYMDDNRSDIVDYRRKIPYTDTLAVHVPHMLALQFRTKYPNNVPLIQEAILKYLNSREGILAPYEQFRANLEREAKFHHDQLEKLDSLTSAFYFAGNHAQITSSPWNLVMGTREVELFLEDIQEEMEQLQQTDNRLAYSSAPVVLQTPFVVNPHAVNGPIRCTAIGLLLGWLFGLMVAALVEYRKEILQWLKTK